MFMFACASAFLAASGHSSLEEQFKNQDVNSPFPSSCYFKLWSQISTASEYILSASVLLGFAQTLLLLCFCPWLPLVPWACHFWTPPSVLDTFWYLFSASLLLQDHHNEKSLSTPPNEDRSRICYRTFYFRTWNIWLLPTFIFKNHWCIQNMNLNSSTWFHHFNILLPESGFCCFMEKPTPRSPS